MRPALPRLYPQNGNANTAIKMESSSLYIEDSNSKSVISRVRSLRRDRSGEEGARLDRGGAGEDVPAGFAYS